MTLVLALNCIIVKEEQNHKYRLAEPKFISVDIRHYNINLVFA